MKTKGLLISLFALCACSQETRLLHSESTADLAEAVSEMQLKINEAEQQGCKIQNVNLGAGYGLGVGVGIKIDESCPDCAGQDFNETVIKSRKLYALVAQATCPIPSDQ